MNASSGGTCEAAPNSFGMQHAVYKCPETNINMLTGLHYQDTTFDEISQAPVKLHCPLCGKVHVVPLRRRRAWLRLVTNSVREQ